MPLNKKLRELRLSQKLTQEEVAEYLSVSAQSVSKWERGLLSPDIHLLPKIAVLYNTSIDALFDMAFYWDADHQSKFREKIKQLASQKDRDGVYRAYIAEIERMPDHFAYYVDLMQFVSRRKTVEDEYIGRLIRLANYADAHCHDDDIRNEIHRLMVQICASSTNAAYQPMAKKYYMQLPQLRHSREVYAGYVLSGEEYQKQLRENILSTVDLCECAVRQMITPEMSVSEKLFYHKKAAELYEVILDDKFAGFYDIPLLQNDIQIARFLVEVGQVEEADGYIEKAIRLLERFLDADKRTSISVFLPFTHPSGHTSPTVTCMNYLRTLVEHHIFESYQERFTELLRAFTREAEREKTQK